MSGTVVLKNFWLRVPGKWIGNGEVTLNAVGQPMADFCICRSRDYDLNLDVKRLEGNGCVLIGMRDQNRDRMLTNGIYWYLGTDNNISQKLELNTGWIWHIPVVKSVASDSCIGMLKKDEWTRVRMRCKGNSLQGWINGEKIVERTVENCPMEGAVEPYSRIGNGCSCLIFSLHFGNGME